MVLLWTITVATRAITETMTNYTTVSFHPEHKSAVDDAQDALADELGFEPSKGDTVVHLCKKFVEGTE